MYRILLIVFILCAACNATASPTATPTETVTFTPSATLTASETATITPTPTNSPTSTASPTASDTPTLTPTPTQSPTPVNTPLPTPILFFDEWELVDLPDSVTGGLSSPRIAFVNQNNSETIRNLSTAQPPTNNETLYFASPSNPADRIPILELDAATGDQIYLAPLGNAVSYFVSNSREFAPGLYVLDIPNGISGRILTASSLTARGLFNAPSWHPDGRRIAVVVESGYSLDIMTFSLDSSTWRPLIDDGSFDFWPRWSPDGRYLAFVSDRAVCPTWNPTQSDACDPDVDPLPTGGNLYVMEAATNTITQLSDQYMTEPPYWINNRQIAFAVGGDQFDLLNQSRTLWIATPGDGTSRPINLADRPEPQFNVSETWSANGTRVIFQHITDNAAETVVMDTNGTRLATIDDLTFARFTLSAAWSPDGTRLALGGSGGQCPFGIRVLDENYSVVARGNQPRSMCEPVFSPDGQYIAISGVNPSVGDGRVDIYSTSPNGFNAINLTANLRGQMILLGWVGPQP